MSILKESTTKTYLGLINELVGGLIEVDFVQQIIGPTHKAEQGDFTILRNNQEIARFSMFTMPGCCGIVVSTGASVEPQYRTLGLGKLLNSMRKQIAWEWGYSTMLCTDIITNLHQQRLLAHNNWHKLLTFTNKRTGNNISIHSVGVNLPTKHKLGFELW